MDTGVIIALIATGVTMLFGIGVVNFYGKKVVTLLAVLAEAFKDGKLTSSELEAIIEAAKNVAKKEVKDDTDSDD